MSLTLQFPNSSKTLSHNAPSIALRESLSAIQRAVAKRTSKTLQATSEEYKAWSELPLQEKLMQMTDDIASEDERASKEIAAATYEHIVESIKCIYKAPSNPEHKALFDSEWDSDFWRHQNIEECEKAIARFQSGS